MAGRRREACCVWQTVWQKYGIETGRSGRGWVNAAVVLCAMRRRGDEYRSTHHSMGQIRLHPRPALRPPVCRTGEPAEPTGEARAAS